MQVGDELRLQRDMAPQPATQQSPHRIGCSLEAAFTDAQVGQPVLFDDGKIAGTIREVTGSEIVVDITRAGVGGEKLRAEKGINFPDTTLRIPALTADDRTNLPFVAGHADIVDLSFVRSPEDVADLIEELERLGAPPQVGIVLKIETRSGFEQLPQILWEAQRWWQVGGDDRPRRPGRRGRLRSAGRGPGGDSVDLRGRAGAGDLGDRGARLAGPHRRPVAGGGHRCGNGAPGRGRHAEQGPYIVDTIDSLERILERMGGHVSKKRALLRPLTSFTLD